jgi:hypothetical protein
MLSHIYATVTPRRLRLLEDRAIYVFQYALFHEDTNSSSDIFFPFSPSEMLASPLEYRRLAFPLSPMVD